MHILLNYCFQCLSGMTQSSSWQQRRGRRTWLKKFHRQQCHVHSHPTRRSLLHNKSIKSVHDFPSMAARHRQENTLEAYDLMYSGSSFKRRGVLQHSLRGATEFYGMLFNCQPLLPSKLVCASLTTRGQRS